MAVRVWHSPGFCSRRGLTIIELCIGLCVTLLIAAALTGLSLSTAAGWMAGEASQSADRASRQAVLQVTQALRAARYVGLATVDGETVSTVAGPSDTASSTNAVAVGSVASVTPPSSVTDPGTPGAALMLWAEDDGDGFMQVRELALIEHDRVSRTLRLYRGRAGGSGAETVFYDYDIADSGDAAVFKTLPAVESRVLAYGVSRAGFVRRTASQGRQSVEFIFQCGAPGRERPQYGAASLRAYTVPQRPAI
jgi:hypothetical protein